MLWILLAAGGAPLQVMRNALQRSLVGDAGPWGATLVRFLFGLPFALGIFAVVALATPEARPQASLAFFLAAAIGAVAQVTATAAQLVAMRRAGFAVAVVMQQSSLPLGAIVGALWLNDVLSVQAWAGIAATSVGVGVTSWPRDASAKGAFAGASLGVASGAAFAIALNAYRQAGHALEPRHAIYAATGAVCVAQAFQSLVLTAILAVVRPAALGAVARSWRQSLGAGFFGAAASACTFAALALAPAGQVRAVGVVETPFAALVGRRMFRERLSRRQLIGGALTAAGVVATALG